jgi:hypothetical protein
LEKNMADVYPPPQAPYQEPKKKSNTAVIIIIVLLVLLCCCLAAMTAVWYLWTYGDQIFGLTQFLASLLI